MQLYFLIWLKKYIIYFSPSISKIMLQRTYQIKWTKLLSFLKFDSYNVTTEEAGDDYQKPPKLKLWIRYPKENQNKKLLLYNICIIVSEKLLHELIRQPFPVGTIYVAEDARLRYFYSPAPPDLLYHSSSEAGSFRSKQNSFFIPPCLPPTGRCRLMWPPSAWPTANSSPQIGHSCILSLLDPSSPGICGFLWLARCPPSAWKDGNCFLHVLHSKTLPGGDWLASSRPGETKTHIFDWSSLLGLYKYTWSKYLSISRYLWSRKQEWMFLGQLGAREIKMEIRY
jgi:hypothetical protein